jgi:hypothetical protein
MVYDFKTRRFRDALGRFVSRGTIRAAVNRIVSQTFLDLQAITARYQAGLINISEWQIESAQTLRAAHTLSAGIALGGKNSMSLSDLGWIGQKMRFQYERLNLWALRIEEGQVIYPYRLRLYANAARMTFNNALRLRMPISQLGIWITNAKESCAGCFAQASRGEQLIASFPQLGSNECGMNCQCDIEAA